jgi:hypothetical protein
MKGKIIYSDYLPGYSSTVRKQTKYGEFCSEVFLQEEDKDIDNSFDGCRIAEFDCNLKATKEKAKWMRQRAIGARTLYNNIRNYYPIEQNQYELLDAIGAQAYYMEREADKARDYYERMKDYRPIYIENLLKRRRETRSLIHHKKDSD